MPGDIDAVRPRGSAAHEHAGHASGGLPNRVARLALTMPMQRGGSTNEMAQAIVWRLSA